MELKTNNSEIVNEIANALKLQRYKEGIPQKINPLISPVIDAKPIRNNVVANRKTTTGTLYTAPSDKDFYITGFNMNITAIAQAEALIYGAISIKLPNGDTEELCRLYSHTRVGEAVNEGMAQTIKPLKVKRGETITATGSGTTAINATLFGFTEESMD